MTTSNTNPEGRSNPLTVEALVVKYGKTTVLDGVSFAVPPGSVTALLGRNGSGKTSLVRCLLGQQKPRAGICRIDGHDTWSDRVLALKRVAVVPEEPDAPPEMSPQDLGWFSSYVCPSWDQASFVKRLKQFQLPEKTPFQKLSRGQKALSMLAMALSSRPQVLILDDPSLGLDAVARQILFEEVLGTISEDGLTVLITTHDLDAIETIAGHVAVLSQSRIVTFEETECLKARFRKLTYGVDRPEDPSEAGKELDEFDSVKVKVRGWGVEVIVSNYSEDRFLALSQKAHVVDTEAHTLTLREIFIALAGEEKREAGK